MAKIGREVEGKRHYGKMTLFVSYDEVTNETIPSIKKLIEEHDLRQIYISDHDGFFHIQTLRDILRDFHEIGTEVAITIETKKIADFQTIPHDIDIMLNITDGTSIEQMTQLCYDDEIKVSVGQTVFSFNMDDAVFTSPKEFEKDIEVAL